MSSFISLPTLLGISGFTILATWCLTGWFRIHALQNGLLDIPNDRSSHSIPTPRGGGIGFVIVFVAAILISTALNVIDSPEAIALLGSVWVAGVGFYDDKKGLMAPIRLAAHLAAAAWALGWLGYFPRFGSEQFLNNVLLYIFVVIGITWFINLTNFMDGIDGIAAVEVISVSLVSFFLASLNGMSGVATIWILLMTSVAGFLIWNWPPARIFMGDVGSGFLGCIVAVTILLGSNQNQLTFWSPLIMMSVFIVDATFTLLKRMIGGASWYAPHRIHAYQLAARRWGHLRVVQAVILINFIWLAPLAVCAAIWHQLGIFFLLLAWTPLILSECYLGAGQSELNANVVGLSSGSHK